MRLELLKKKRTPWVRVEKPDAIVSVFADKPLESAVETATVNLMDWLVTEYGFTPTDAYCLVSCCPDFRINVYQMCKIAKLSFVAGAEIPKLSRPVIARGMIVFDQVAIGSGEPPRGAVK